MKAYVLMSGDVALKVFLDEEEARNELRDGSFQLNNARKAISYFMEEPSERELRWYVGCHHPKIMYVFNKVGLSDLSLVEKELV